MFTLRTGGAVLCWPHSVYSGSSDKGPNGVHMADSLQDDAMSGGRHRARHTGPPEPARHPATRG
ncbi:hypothetical protein EMIT0158MI4_90306 [Burkholderia ambifaria]